MSRKIATGAVAAFAMAASMAYTPAYAAGPFDITVTPDEGLPSATFTVTGDAVDPICTDDGVAVRLFYTQPDGATGSVSVNTVADSAGHFSAQLTVPDTAVAGAPASVSALVADCTPATGPSEGARASELVAFDVLAYQGALKLSHPVSKPGQTVKFTGSNCWGGDVAVFLDEFEIDDVTLLPNKNFSGSFVVPALPGGTYEFAAECPGTDYQVLAFTIVNPAAPVAPPAPPARPVPRRPRYTG